MVGEDRLVGAAKLVLRAWKDADFKSRLLADATRALSEIGLQAPEGVELKVYDNTGPVHHVVVCSQCSCWVSFLAPMPPFWKNDEYTKKVMDDPKGALVEMGLMLDEHERVEVVDTTPKVRAMVIPKHPASNGALTDAALARHVNNLNIAGYAR